MTQTTRRLLHVTALLCLIAVGIALVSQHAFHLRPCAWCVLQRLVYLSVALICWLALIFGRIKLIRRLAALAALALCAGGATAAWYQYDVAAKLFSCSQTFADQFMVASGLDAHVPWLFGIFASCTDAQVSILAVEYAIWSLGLFCVLALLCLAALVRRD